MEGEVTKIYVNSPLFSSEDEKLYHYVNPNPDDLDELHLESKDTVHEIQKSKELDHFEDLEHFYDWHSCKSPKLFAIHEANQIKQKSVIPFQADQMFTELKDEAEEELLEMEERNQIQRRQAQQNNIPQLDLVDSEDEEKTRKKAYTDLEIHEGRHSVPDKTTAEMIWTAKQKNMLMKGLRMNEERVEDMPNCCHHETVLTSGFPIQSIKSHCLSVGYEKLDNRKFQVQLPSVNVNMPVQSHCAPCEVQEFQPFHAYLLDNTQALELDSSFSQPARHSKWTGEQNGRRKFGSESNMIKNLPMAEPFNKHKDYVKANKKEVVKKEKPKVSYGEMFSKKKKKENNDTNVLQRMHPEEIESQNPLSVTHGVQNNFRDLGEPLSVKISPPLQVNTDQETVGNFLHQQPVESTLYLSDAVEQKQQISIPIHIKGISSEGQQNISVGINLRLMKPEVNLPQQQMHGIVRNQSTSKGTAIAADNGIDQRTNHLPPINMNPYPVPSSVGSSGMNQTLLPGYMPQMIEKELVESAHMPIKRSYLEQMKKQRQPPQYKEYTLGDYRRMKKEINTLNLGKLGPDLDNEEHFEKQMKEKRKQMYSQQVKQRCRMQLAVKSHRDSTEDDGIHHESTVDKRRTALEYAKTIPKPTVFIRDANKTFISRDSNKQDGDRELFADELEELKMLKERHDLERKQLELIEKGVKTILAQHA